MITPEQPDKAAPRERRDCVLVPVGRSWRGVAGPGRWTTSRVQVSRIAPFAAPVLTAISGGCFCKDTLREKKLADCTTNAFAFRLVWPTGELFQVVLGVPYADTNALSFRGEVVFRQSTDVVARLPVGSHDVMPCNWLDNHASAPHVAGYILTWSRTNALGALFTKGETYDVEVRFSELPPPTSTLWLHWIDQIGH